MCHPRVIATGVPRVVCCDRSDGASAAILNEALREGRDNFRDIKRDSHVPRKSKPVVYLGFSPR